MQPTSNHLKRREFGRQGFLVCISRSTSFLTRAVRGTTGVLKMRDTFRCFDHAQGRPANTRSNRGVSILTRLVRISNHSSFCEQAGYTRPQHIHKDNPAWNPFDISAQQIADLRARTAFQQAHHHDCPAIHGYARCGCGCESSAGARCQS